MYLRKIIKKHFFPYLRYFYLDPINKEYDKKNPPKKKKTSTAKKALTMNIPTVFSDTIFKILSYAPPFGKGDVTKNS